MIEFFDTISSYIDKITKFFDVILNKLSDAWESIQIFTKFFPVELAGLIILVVVIVIVFRILGR